MKEETLSDLIEEHGWVEDKDNPKEADQYGEVLWTSDVKEFIKKLKERQIETFKATGSIGDVIKLIDKLAGDKLI